MQNDTGNTRGPVPSMHDSASPTESMHSHAPACAILVILVYFELISI